MGNSRLRFRCYLSKQRGQYLAATKLCLISPCPRGRSQWRCCRKPCSREATSGKHTPSSWAPPVVVSPCPQTSFAKGRGGLHGGFPAWVLEREGPTLRCRHVAPVTTFKTAKTSKSGAARWKHESHVLEQALPLHNSPDFICVYIYIPKHARTHTRTHTHTHSLYLSSVYRR